jgi:ADP-ribose pyrophosphatase YjhB (NUDIX family)
MTKGGTPITEDLIIELAREAEAGYDLDAGTVREISKLEPVPTAGVVILNADRVLLVAPGTASQHQKGVFALPSGHVDPGETAEQCAVRECFEETGLVLNAADLVQLPRGYVATLSRRDGGHELMSFVVFVTKKFTGGLRACDEGTPLWVPCRSLPELRLQLNVGDAIAQAQLVVDGSAPATA